MAQYLSLLTRWVCTALLSGIATTSFADMPHDPTQPPASIATVGPNGNATTGSAIQSITIRGSQRYAMVNGTMVKPGDTLSEGRIVKITENAVIVKSATGLTALKLFPNVEKRMHPPAKSTHQPSVHRN